MRKNQILFVSLLISFLGLFLLFFLIKEREPSRVSISEISDELVGKFIETKGWVRGIYVKNGNIFLSLCEEKCITVVIFSKSANELKTNPYIIKKGDKLVVRGVVKRYRGEMEIIPLGSYGIELE